MTGSSGDCHGDSIGEPTSVDRLLCTLGKQQRRAVVEYCRRHPERTIHVEELADYVVEARRRTGDDVDQQAVLSRLHHVDLPKLADVGVLEFDHQSGRLRYRPTTGSNGG